MTLSNQLSSYACLHSLQPVLSWSKALRSPVVVQTQSVPSPSDYTQFTAATMTTTILLHPMAISWQQLASNFVFSVHSWSALHVRTTPWTRSSSAWVFLLNRLSWTGIVLRSRRRLSKYRCCDRRHRFLNGISYQLSCIWWRLGLQVLRLLLWSIG